MIKPTLEELNAIDLSEKVKLLNGHPDGKYFNLLAGTEHYRLLHWLGSKYSQIIEFGTFRLLSALALYHRSNQIISYDIEKHDPAVWIYPLSYLLIVDDFNEDLETVNFIEDGLVMLDTFHDGLFEQKVINYLVKIKWKGVLIADDIHWNAEMEAWWNRIKQRKEDWTDVGHWSGTGIIYFE